MKIYLRAIVIVVFALLSSVASSYELATHGAMTKAAFENSVLNDTTFRADLGLPEAQNPFGEVYYDVTGNNVRERKISDVFEGKLIKMDLGADPLSLVGWLMRGAIREDDLGQILGVNVGDDPHDDPYGNIFRVFNHFYDPVLDRPLTTIAGVLGQKAPDWGMGSANAFTQPNTPDSSRRNHFTVFDAREAIYRALTGRDSQGNVIAATEADRNKYWATTFRALGDVVHLVQDMGQPQHARNDAHSGVPGFGHKSIFEEYIEMRATSADSYTIDGTKVTPLQLTYDGYPLPTFTKYSDFWSTRNGVSGRGLADYSNRGFFSAGTNLGSNVYASPSNDPASHVKESAAGLLPNQPLQKINFLKGDVYDYNLNPGTANIRMTTESLFDYFLFTKKTYSFNRFNYNDMADLLIPRAVGYSAGLINYFFRGKIDVVPDPINAGKYIIKNLGPEDMKGTFTLYYDAADGKRYPVAGAAPDKTWTDIAIAKGGQADNLSFTPPTDPAPKASGEYLLVFNGDMGEEKAGNGSMAVAAKKIETPGALLITKYISSGSYLVYRSTDLGKSWAPISTLGDYGQMIYIGDNAVLSPGALSTNGGSDWISLPTDRQLAIKRGTAERIGNNQLIGTIAVRSPTGQWPDDVQVAFSSDKGVSWTAGQTIPELKLFSRKPAYMGNNQLVVKSYYPTGNKVPCVYPDNGTRCDTYTDGVFRSADGGLSWGQVSGRNNLSNDIIYLGKNKLVNGALIPDKNGGDTLFASSFDYGSKRGGFARSNDGGVTWEETGYPIGLASTADPWYLAYAGNKTILAYFNDGGSYDYLYKSTDNGLTWALAGKLPPGTASIGLFDMVFVGDTKAIPGLK